VQREAHQARDLRDKENKENNNLANIPLGKLHKPRDMDPLCKPRLEHKLTESTSLSSQLVQEALPEQLKKTYSLLVRKDYSADILSHLCATAQPQRDMLAAHSISASLRSKMVDWMIEVLSSYKMAEETFFRSVFLMDSYLRQSSHRLEVKDLHLIGVSAMFSAAKYEEIHPLKLSVIFEKIARKKFRKSEILDKESDIVKTLNFQLEAPSVYDIARHLVGTPSFTQNRQSFPSARLLGSTSERFCFTSARWRSSTRSWLRRTLRCWPAAWSSLRSRLWSRWTRLRSRRAA
jgi:hypothetical protein